MNTSISLHIIGVVMWLGSMIVLSRILALGAKHQAPIETFKLISKRIFFAWSLPGAILTLSTGIYQLLARGMAGYFAQGWFHGKITFVIILLVSTAILFFKIIEIQSGKWPKVGTLMALHGATGLALIFIVGLTVLGR